MFVILAKYNSFFSQMDMFLMLYLRNPCLTEIMRIFSFDFFYRFYNFKFYFRPMVHFELTFYKFKGMSWCLRFAFGCLIVPAPFIKQCILPSLNYHWTFVTINWFCFVHIFLGSLFCSIHLCVCLFIGSHCLDP